VVIFAMKSFDTAAAASQLRDQLSLFKVVLCLQNGVENEAVIAEVVGGGKVMTGSISSAVERTGLGQARLERLRGIGIGSQHPLAGALFTDFQAAALKPMLIRDASAMKWTKMLSNLLGNATAAILDMPPGAIFAHPVGYQIERRQILEAITVMRKMGIRVINLPGTPMVWLKRLMLIFPAGLARPVLAKVMGSGRGNKMPSFHIDLHAGRPRLESGYLNGAVVRFGKRVGVETPVNAALDQLLQELIGRPDLQAEYKANPEKLFAYIRQFSASGKAGA
jgi:2-dehydropantoate 2-reductase